MILRFVISIIIIIILMLFFLYYEYKLCLAVVKLSNILFFPDFRKTS